MQISLRPHGARTVSTTSLSAIPGSTSELRTEAASVEDAQILSNLEEQDSIVAAAEQSGIRSKEVVIGMLRISALDRNSAVRVNYSDQFLGASLYKRYFDITA